MQTLCTSELWSFFWHMGCRDHWPCDLERFEKWQLSWSVFPDVDISG